MNVIIDHGSGNLRSIQWAFQRAGSDAVISGDAETIAQAQRLILPGVGAFGAAMAALDSKGLRAVLQRKVMEEHTPILGICLGFQMLHAGSEEGEGAGLGWLPGIAKRFQPPRDAGLAVPHLGWNSVKIHPKSAIMANNQDGADFYFAHSYYVATEKADAVAGETDYGVRFTAVVEEGPIFGAQFHPEKSHMNGLRFLQRFLELSAHA